MKQQKEASRQGYLLVYCLFEVNDVNQSSSQSAYDSCLNYSQTHHFIAMEHISRVTAEPELCNDANHVCTLK